MKVILVVAALGAMAPAAPALAQYRGGTPLQEAASVYGQCVYQRARAARQGGASADSAIASGFSLCKRERKRTLNETRSRIAAAGMKGDSARTGAQTMIDSGDRMMTDSLRREFAGPAAAPK